MKKVRLFFIWRKVTVRIRNNNTIKTSMWTSISLIGFGVFVFLGHILKEPHAVPLKKEQFDHLNIISSIILSLAVTSLLTNIGHGLQNRDEIKHCIPLYLWVFLMFLGMLQFWWASWVNFQNLSPKFHWGLLFLLIPIFWYLASAVVFPGQELKETYRIEKDNRSSKIDLERYYFENKKKIYFPGLIIALLVTFYGNLFLEKFGTNKWLIKNLIRMFYVFAFTYLIVEGNSNKPDRKRKNTHIVLLVIIGLTFIIFIISSSLELPPIG